MEVLQEKKQKMQKSIENGYEHVRLPHQDERETIRCELKENEGTNVDQ